MVRLALCLLLVVAARAAADEDPAVEAKRHFDEAVRLFAEADYDAAVGEYLAAYNLKPHPNGLYNIAVAYERVYKPEEARRYYERFLREASEAEAGELRGKVEARLRVLRALPGFVVVNTVPPGAAVELRGKSLERRCVSPCKIGDLQPGSYSVGVELPEHATARLDVDLAPGATAALTVPLEHHTENLTVFTRPDGARVFIDGKEEGRTPFSRALETGRGRKLRVEAADFPPHLEVVDLKAGRPQRRDIRFRRPVRSGRSELVIGAMTYGGFVGVATSEIAGVGRDLPILVLAGIGGVGLGFLASWLATDDYVKVGHSSIIMGATTWGTVAGLGFGLGLDMSAKNTWATSLLGSGLGLAAGILAARLEDTSPGDAAVVNSGALWGTATGLLLTEAIGFPSSSHDRALGWFTLGGCALGLASGIVAARFVEISRGHSAIVDVGALAGLALAFGIGYGTSADNERWEQGARYGLGGMALGLVAAAIFSRWYKDDLPPTESVVSMRGGRISLGLPRVSLGVGDLRDARLSVGLAGGSF